MDINELQAIESEEAVAFSFNLATGKIGVKGKSDAAIDRALERIASRRDEVAALLRERQGIEDEEVERQIAFNVPSLEVQRANYLRWLSPRPAVYHPNDAELDTMFAAVEEGDEIIFDFCHSFTVRKPNGLLIQVDRKGRVMPPSPYSPAVMQQKRNRGNGNG